MSHPKKGIRWKLFNLFGPPEIQNLIRYIDELTADGSDIVIYPSGEFSFNVKASNAEGIRTTIFLTAAERASFQQGLNYGVGLMGGTTTPLSKEDFEIIDQMSKKTTHSGGGGSVN